MVDTEGEGAEMGPMEVGVGIDRWSEYHGDTFSGIAGKTVHFFMLN